MQGGRRYFVLNVKGEGEISFKESSLDVMKEKKKKKKRPGGVMLSGPHTGVRFLPQSSKGSGAREHRNASDSDQIKGGEPENVESNWESEKT